MSALPDLYKLYKLPHKGELYPSFPSPIWSSPLTRWVSTNPRIIKEILNSPSFSVIKHEINKVEDKFHINLSHLVKLVKFLPVAQEGPEHKELRKKIALTIQKNSAKSIEFFESEFNHQFTHLLNSKSEIDLCQDLLLPVIQKTNQMISGAEKLNTKELNKISTVFDETLNLDKRIELNHSLEQIIQVLNDDFELEDCYFRIALFALGNDSALSTLSESMIHVFMKNPDQTLSSINWNEQIPVTGVPVIERVCLTDVDIDGTFFKKNQRVRLYLDAAGYQGDGCPHHSPLYFGSGSHLCLGMPIATKMWTVIISACSKVHKKIEVLEIKPRKNDNVFNVYEAIKIKIYD